MKQVLLMLVALCALTFGQQNLLVNPGFEADETGKVPGWEVLYSGKVVVDTQNVHGGKNSVMGEHVQGGADFGLRQEIVFEKPDKTPIMFGGWSRAETIIGAQDYNIYMDVFYEDGTNLWEVTTGWESGTHDWQFTFHAVWPAKPVAKIKLYAFLRKQAYGRAWFDDFVLYRAMPDAQLGARSIHSAAPMSDNGLFVEARFCRHNTKYTARFLDSSGQELASTSGEGKIRWVAELPRRASSLEVVSHIGDKTRKELIPVTAKLIEVQNPVQGKYRVWTADSMTNVSPLTYPGAKAGESLDLELAKGEFESGQIQVTAGNSPLKSVKVKLPELKDASGNKLSGTLKWERIGYIPRRRPYSFHPNGYGMDELWLPDPLLPAREFTVCKNATQGVWITAHANRDAKAGIYRGDVQVDIDGETTRVPLSVTVFDFELPKTFSYPTAFCIMDGWLFDAYPEGDLNARRRQAWDIMLDHRLNPDDISRTEPPRVEDLLYARDRGMNRFNILNLVPKPKNKVLWVCFSPTEVYTPELFEEFKRRLDPYVAELRKHDLSKMAYVYGFDERYDEFYPIMDSLHKKLKASYPEIAFMTTSRMYRSLLAKPDRTDCYANDWYCPVTREYDDALSARLRARGHQVWWYTCCGPQHPYANFASLEYPFIEGRLLAWMGYQHRVDGFLYWHVNLWRGSYRFDESVCFQPGFEASLIRNMSGDGQLLYPGVDGPLPSIRLANIRDGSEDYDYLTMAGERSRGLCDELAPSMTDFTRDPKKLREARRRLASWLESQ